VSHAAIVEFARLRRLRQDARPATTTSAVRHEPSTQNCVVVAIR
jgi:hypothetical protein